MNMIKTAERAASSARGGFVDLGTELLKLVNSARRTYYRDALDYVGLQPKQSVLVPIATFAAGAAIGGAIALFFTPVTGRQLRRRLKTTATGTLEDAEERAKQMANNIREAATQTFTAHDESGAVHGG